MTSFQFSQIKMSCMIWKLSYQEWLLSFRLSGKNELSIEFWLFYFLPPLPPLPAMLPPLKMRAPEDARWCCRAGDGRGVPAQLSVSEGGGDGRRLDLALGKLNSCHVWFSPAGDGLRGRRLQGGEHPSLSRFPLTSSVTHPNQNGCFFLVFIFYFLFSTHR